MPRLEIEEDVRGVVRRNTWSDTLFFFRNRRDSKPWPNDRFPAALYAEEIKRRIEDGTAELPLPADVAMWLMDEVAR